MKMKNFVRLLALLIALLMCVAVFAACDDAADDGDEKGELTENGGTYDATKDENGRLLDNLPDDLNFMGEEVTTLYWSDAGKIEFESETITGDNVSDAVYDRNAQIMDRLNVELTWASTPGNVKKRAAFVKKVESVYTGGTQDYDLIAAYARTEGMCAIQGYLVDLNTVEDTYLDLEKPWWPQELLDTVDINGSMYFISGDCSTNLLYEMNCMFLNKTMFNQRYNTEARAQDYENGCKMLYDIVYKGQWTVDKLIELTTGVYDDRNKSGGCDLDDVYGFSSVYYIVDSFYTAAHMRYVEHDDDMILKISPDYGSRKTVLLVEKLGNWLTTDDCWCVTSDQDDFTTPFKQGRSIFVQARANFAENSLLKVNFSYGLVPTPKYDLKQTNYYTCEGNPFSLYGIFGDCKARDGSIQETYSMLTAVLECWCSEGYRLTTPEIFEVNMQLKYSETDDESTMFEYTRSGIVFDLGMIFSNDLAFMTEKPSMSATVGASWSTAYAAYKKSLNAKLATIVETFKKYQGLA